MSKTTDLLKNTGILTIGTFSSKLLVFFLLPLYTYILTTSEYGSYDIIYSTITLLIPIFTLNVSDAILRFSLDSSINRSIIIKLGFVCTIFASFIAIIAQLFTSYIGVNLVGIDYFGILFATNAIYQLLLCFAKGLDKMIDVAIAGLISTLSILSLNIILLLFAGWGLNGFFIANTLGMALPSIYLVIKFRCIIFCNTKITKKDLPLFQAMIRYSIPLGLAAVGWWFINVSGRYIVAYTCGMEDNGLLAIAYKIPSILSIVSNIFLQSWQLSAIKEYDKYDSDNFLSNTFNNIETIIISITSFLIMFSPIIASLLFSGDFYKAWVFVPTLLVSVIFNTMSAMYSPFFSANYDTKPMTISTLLAGLSNLILGIPLTILFGLKGATISAVIASFVNWLYRGISVKKHIDFFIHMKKSFFSYFILLIQGFCITSNLPLCCIVISQLVCLCLLFLLNKTNIKYSIVLLKTYLHLRKKR